MITDVRNHASMGAGCTVWLDRRAVTEFVMAEGDEEVTRVLERGAEVRFTVPEVFGRGWRMIGGFWGGGERGWWLVYYLWEGGELFVFVRSNLTFSTHHHEH